MLSEDDRLAQWAADHAGLPSSLLAAAREEAVARRLPLADVLVMRGILSIEQLPDFPQSGSFPAAPPPRVTVVAQEPGTAPPFPAPHGDSVIADTHAEIARGPHTVIMDGSPSLPDGPITAVMPTFSPPGAGPRRFGKFLLIEELGTGGMGTVYRAFQNDLQREVALKVLHGAAAAGAAVVERFRREARAAARLEHPGIVRVYEVGCEDGIDYFTMEYVAGESLAQRTTHGNPPIPERVKWIRDAAVALQYAHDQNLIHRDLKPQNLLVDAWGAVKVADFGLARDVTSGKGITLSGQAIGTPHYMSPEQAAGEWEVVGRLSDVYSLGATLYEVLAGVPPVKGAAIHEVMQSVVDGKVVPLREVARNLPRDLETIVMKCLESDPKRRFPSMQELANDLDRFLRFEAIQARPVSFLGRRLRDARRHWRRIFFSAAVFALLAGALAYGNARLNELERAKQIEREGAQHEHERAENSRKAHDLLLAAVNPDAILNGGGAREQIRLLNDALVLDPSFGDARFRLGLVLEGTGQIEEAAREYRTAFEADPGFVRAGARLAMLLQHYNPFLPAGREPYAEGTRRLAELVRDHPQDPHVRQAQIFSAAVLQDKTATPDQVAQLESIVEAVPDARRLIAGLYGFYRHPAGIDVLARGVRDLDRAQTELEALVGEEPLNFLARMNLGVLRLETGDLAGAQRDLAFVARNAPGWAEPSYYLGRVLYDQGRYAEAERAVRDSIRIQSDPGRCDFLAVVLIFRRDFAGAFEVVQAAYPPGQEASDALFLTAFILFCLKRDAEARTDLQSFVAREQVWVDKLRAVATEMQKPMGAMMAKAIRDNLLHFPDLLFLAPAEKRTVRELFRTVLALPQVREMVQRYHEGTAMRREVEDLVSRFSELEAEVPEITFAWRGVLEGLGITADPHLLMSLAEFGTKLSRDADLRSRSKLHNLDDLLWRAGARYRAGKLEAARDDLREALRVDQASAKAHYGLATIQALMGDAPGCADSLRNARQFGWAHLDFVPEDPDFDRVKAAKEVQEVLNRGK